MENFNRASLVYNKKKNAVQLHLKWDPGYFQNKTKQVPLTLLKNQFKCSPDSPAKILFHFWLGERIISLLNHEARVRAKSKRASCFLSEDITFVTPA